MPTARPTMSGTLDFESEGEFGEEFPGDAGGITEVLTEVMTPWLPEDTRVLSEVTGVVGPVICSEEPSFVADWLPLPEGPGVEEGELPPEPLAMPVMVARIGC